MCFIYPHWPCYGITRNSQGLDWHGPSADDVWGTISALANILGSFSKWKAWAIAPEKVVIIGHSNGGQGTWHNAARHPDRVVASNINYLPPWNNLR
jgi:pimeloyl-ACP methyl ester carboxylesterase